MNRFLFAGLAGFALLAAMPLRAATLIPVVPVPGSVETDVFAINDNNMIAGGYLTSDGVEHGFFGTLDGQYTTFDFGSGNTQVRGIDNAGNTVGLLIGNGGHCTFQQFSRASGGTITPVTKRNKAVNGIPGNFSSKDLFVGDYCTKDGTITGYLGKEAKYKSDITIDADNLTTSPRGIDKQGNVAGYFLDKSTGGDVGFLITDGETTVGAFPDQSVVDTLFQSLNNGVVSGHWDAGDFIWHAFTYDPSAGMFTTIEVPGATSVESFGINKQGFVTLLTDAGSFVYCPLKKKNCPKGGTQIVEHKIRVAPGAFLDRERYARLGGHGLAAKPAGMRDGDGLR